MPCLLWRHHILESELFSVRGFVALTQNTWKPLSKNIKLALMLNAGKRWTGRMVILMTITYWFNFRDFLNIQRIANLHWRLLLPNGWMELLSMAIVIEKWPKSISHEICLLLNSFGCIKGRQWDKKKWIRPARGMDTSRIERMNKRANLHTMFYFDRFILPDLKWNINKKSIEVKHGKKNISKRFKGFFYFCFISSSVIKDLIFNLGQSNWLCLWHRHRLCVRMSEMLWKEVV